MALAAGDELDGYRILSRRHAGGMAVIYDVARDDLPAPAVMKVPRFGQGDTGATIVGFEVEQMVLATGDGDPLPRLFGQGDLAATPYLVMERIEGTVIADLVDQAPLPFDALRRIGIAVAEALDSLHRRDIIHLDIKPSNIILRPDGRASLIDLGLAHHRRLPDLLAEEIRRPVGSAPYISPEQVLGVRNESRSDLFALGVMLYELATGKLPYGAPSGLSGMRRRLHVQPLPPRAHRPDLPPALQEVILRCLEIEPAKRYATGHDLAADLQHPESMQLGERAHRSGQDGVLQRLRRWFVGVGLEPAHMQGAPVSSGAGQVPIVLVSVAVNHTNAQAHAALRREAERLARGRPEARLAFITVVRPPPAMGTAEDSHSAPREHLRVLVALRNWAAEVDVEAARVTCHVVEGADPAEAVLDYVRSNHVDTLLLGAPPASLADSRLLQPVAVRIALQAPCTVVIARVPQA
ncbi:bifunctional serine/threonine-protein kinase/universal stress protein [Viridibacterium curvum]|uniref:Bifunctional serine/threonine-protein kinase/universal stress protein n=1 Tax=Viridibacterium curvum TaxID=1101404 RepID=A0ABP9QM16_9RHOO